MTDSVSTDIQRAQPCYIQACGLLSALGHDEQSTVAALKKNQSPGMVSVYDQLNNGKPTVVGAIHEELQSLEHLPVEYRSRNNQLIATALSQIAPQVQAAVSQFGPDRVAVVAGTSTSGINRSSEALQYMEVHGELPEDFHYHQQETAAPSDFVSYVLRLEGPSYTVSTACSSSARAMMSAQMLLESHLVDAVLVVGADTLCPLTLNGFNCLEALSFEPCLPFSVNRSGINIGEAVSVMLLGRDKPEHGPVIALLGAGASSDAHHISAPHPEGEGAIRAMQCALDQAGLTVEDIGYINAHGTATPLNDAMESKAIYQLFADKVPVSSTKPLTGHTLGAAGAIEAAISYLVLKHQLTPPAQLNDGQRDPEIAPILLQQQQPLAKPRILSNSFAFGGNNMSLILGREDRA
ncbi:hypothetical protein VST7929_01861 [Vibrio stylophorae]|uniref:Ketosynthase family 3 (KS3) domain-containing protein n=1 Tax=Vibrio stylophorae TaxID=659351 RepID=A0ABM8ZUH4_9VIBR|nr:beta-ketoacyl-[acyl-carrier-protein] synthase family protein [Vibrio stylophorae]CAH0533979.1 hypothetical protein VST7929_01861 [Vibrio stylophorae]